ncbi:MAG: iron complex outermembrane receptor protein [Sulfurimonas sp.]|jgi:iron complex outermembrane receptor protein|uniref:TonB-dependent receptor n=1 Tax=Sulfurimonas sp. TaxID=2022749 RepID=UPI0039E6185B
MKKIIPLSLIAVLSLSAAEIELAPIGVESTIITEVAQNAQTSADVAEALSKNVPSIDMVRRSGIANDVYIRGQKRDNISVEVDGTKVHGACPNRMDPPISHVLANQIETIEITEGPYDITTFGTMSGGIKITTKKPTKGFTGEVTAGVGSWGYKKLGATASGGNDTIRVLVTASTESSGQYEDGDGNTLSQQLKNNPNSGMFKYQPKYENMDAYDKKSVMAKAFISVTDKQELRLSYTGNRSDDILYANTKMDAMYDDSNIYSIEYNINNLTNAYKNLNVQYYYSDVDHPMSLKYRMMGTTNYKTNQLQTTMQGVKLKNTVDLDGTNILFGLDGSKRTWTGQTFMTSASTGLTSNYATSLTHTTTENKAIFAKAKQSFGNLDVEIGARYDSTDIVPTDHVTYRTRDYSALNANILTSYHLDDTSKIFLGFGKASRVPDARELYMPSPTRSNDNLEQTTNREIDFGYELNNESMKLKVKTFYSDLKDYIYYNNNAAVKTFQNVDAKVYGLEVSSEFFITDNLIVDASAAYKRGQKNSALTNQSDTDLADMAPLRAKLGATYEYQSNSTISAEVLMSDAWDNYDGDNGEQKIAGWAVANLKAKHAFGKNLGLTVGVNNIFDATFAQSNTYVDLTLLAAGGETMLLNDPGRYLYTNLTYKF